MNVMGFILDNRMSQVKIIDEINNLISSGIGFLFNKIGFKNPIKEKVMKAYDEGIKDLQEIIEENTSIIEKIKAKQ